MVPLRAHDAIGPVWKRWFARPLVWIVEHLYNHNPFYVLSAALVLFGLNAIFQDRHALAHPNAVSLNSWLLLGVVAVYALVLAGTGILIVRLGQVWDDARTILLTLVLLLVAMSVSFDKLVLTSSATLTQVLSVGLVFAIGLSEFVLRGLRIRLPALFRGPFYMVLGLFFLYPVILLEVLDGVGERDPKQGLEWTLWGIFLFPSVAALTTLTLLPAVWRGPRYVADNGTPWRWPLFPWSLFIILAVGIVLRSYYFTLSFHPYPGRQSAFGLYFLVPFLLSACLVIYELGRSVQVPLVEVFALAAPVPLLWLTMPGRDHTPVYDHFLALYMDWAGSPVVLTWWCLVALYGYAWLRGNRLAETGLGALLVVGSVLGPATVDVGSLRFPAVAPLLAATALFTWGAVRRLTESFRWFVAAAAAIGTSTVALWGTSFIAYGAAPIHLLLATLLLLAAAFDDAFARWARRAGPMFLGVLSVAAMIAGPATVAIPELWLLAYEAMILFAAWLCWYDWRERLNLVAAVFVTALWIGKTALMAGRLENARAVLAVVAGAVSFAIALAISLGKAGFWRGMFVQRSGSRVESLGRGFQQTADGAH